MYLLSAWVFLGVLTSSFAEDLNVEQLTSWCNCEDYNETLTVHVKQGALKGRRVESAAGCCYFSFQGIPYAKPPLGYLRFQDAQPPTEWIGVREAFAEGNVCPQLRATVEGNEDCLVLNVYTPTFSPKNNHPLAVMFWIHGGGYVISSGNSGFYGPDYIVCEDVILVTINYRLNVFGFLYLEGAVPSNVGLQDQLAALKWVKGNIATFGGDPERITIFGESSGAEAVHLHMFSPLSNGLFYAAIAQSGNALDSAGKQTEPQETSLQLATAVGCRRENYSAIVECLLIVDMELLVKTAFSPEMLLGEDKERMIVAEFIPTPDTFLPAPAHQLLQEGEYKKVPFLTGFTDRESLILLYYLKTDITDTIADEIDANWPGRIMPETRLPRKEWNNSLAEKALRDFYLNGQPIKCNKTGFYNMMTDILFSEVVFYTLRVMAKYDKAPLFMYDFTMDGSLNTGKIVTGVTHHSGACHGDELGYLFHSSFLPEVPNNSTEWSVRSQMVKMWTNFAKYRNPTPNSKSVWKPYTSEQRNYMEIASKLSPKENLNKRREEFWENFYHKYNVPT